MKIIILSITLRDKINNKKNIGWFVFIINIRFIIVRMYIIQKLVYRIFALGVKGLFLMLIQSSIYKIDVFLNYINYVIWEYFFFIFYLDYF
jgi:hypothetical protein